MTKNPIVAPLMRVGLFQGLKPMQITEIARNAERIVFKAGDMITEAGADGEAAYLIVSGPAAVLGDGAIENEQNVVEAGSLVGEMAMLIEHEYGSSVVARGAVRALKISREALHAQMLDDPCLAQSLMLRIAERLTDVADELKRIDRVFAEKDLLPVIVPPSPVLSSGLAH